MRILALLFALFRIGAAQGFVTTDIENFWRAYDASSAENRASALQRLYLDQASPGLRDFIRVRSLTAENLAEGIAAYPKYYESIRENTLKVATQAPLTNLYLSRFRGLYGAARFPSVYFLIGRLRTGGTFSTSGLLIGTEVWSLGGNADPSEIQAGFPAFYRAMGSIDKLPLIVTHELSHTQQRYAGRPTLISQCLVEGGADFLTSMVSGRTINDYQSQYAEAHRDELFRRFAEDWRRAPPDYSRWLYNFQNVKDEPADLGYWIGMEICRDYFAQNAEKNAAIRNIALMGDTESIVRNSAFAWILNPESCRKRAASFAKDG